MTSQFISQLKQCIQVSCVEFLLSVVTRIVPFIFSLNIKNALSQSLLYHSVRTVFAVATICRNLQHVFTHTIVSYIDSRILKQTSNIHTKMYTSDTSLAPALLATRPHLIFSALYISPAAIMITDLQESQADRAQTPWTVSGLVSSPRAFGYNTVSIEKCRVHLTQPNYSSILSSAASS